VATHSSGSTTLQAVRVIAVPVKALGRSKSRLSRICTPIERAALTLAMLEDVLDAVLAVNGWDVWVISPDEVALEVAARRGAAAFAEERPSLLAAIRQVEAEAVDRAADALAVLLADTPLVSRDAVSRVLATLGPVVLAPSADRAGTNLLLRRPPRSIRPRFGRDSFDNHRREAAAKDLPVSIVWARELAFDLDVPEDILALLDAGTPGRTLDVCVELGLEARIGVRA
jgi:2-phospho-L-lactate guanylyltransferase